MCSYPSPADKSWRCAPVISVPLQSFLSWNSTFFTVALVPNVFKEMLVTLFATGGH